MNVIKSSCMRSMQHVLQCLTSVRAWVEAKNLCLFLNQPQFYFSFRRICLKRRITWRGAPALAMIEWFPAKHQVQEPHVAARRIHPILREGQLVEPREVTKRSWPKLLRQGRGLVHLPPGESVSIGRSLGLIWRPRTRQWRISTPRWPGGYLHNSECCSA